MERRTFIRQTCGACIGAVAMGLMLESCSTTLPLVKVTLKDKLLMVSMDQFTPQNNLLLVRSQGLENDILLVRKDNTYKALNMKCTHEGVGLTATDKHIVCSAHGSLFNFNGDVLKEPALKPLTQFNTETRDGNIIIHLT